MSFNIFIASDHTGLTLKKIISEHLKTKQFNVVDLGPNYFDANDDYPDFAFLVADKVKKNSDKDLGILICGTGVGVCMAANKVKGVLAALVVSEKTAALARQHDNANVLCLSSRFVTDSENIKIVDDFLKANFEGGRHQRRIDKIIRYEKETE
ncbi:ribose 5-phosphate isomerase B [Mycoplasmoides genitalium]|uniref:Probable ribose-5-phosphate isomerase B n=3 Tax=Mycoplasmoides genitalium TaxID=2097 RepID=RPIB_MYCGE|nr:ribose 5-phosphate isomerase B [Mycoplasmoides genitalium]P47636.1 RecName: Full=Probable ribose-5-phosphate isomerase B; AltName: Full=Phosphoriboisomerase B [Mycoplasmoides genitalium G37]ABY79388.1 ribose 5-phosphate isomerase B [synthetic Mycoplasma genitalium JCVI-1.0]AAC71624.1 ribose 5-phosphate isomerase B [Mycoplasmoides genitalium G37]AFQ03240.1 ribose-5-phosphate isomerase B [Mycoplasmoides genitalium M2321]AFQ03723.1 ribose-5-phosphate isomerase B [Mycoplasmoides genitalium M628